jgi:hypothetical protein
MIMQIFENDYIFGFLYYHFSKKKAQDKMKVGIKTTSLLMVENIWSKSPTQVYFHLGRDERIFWKAKSNKQTLSEQKQRKERQQRPNYS